MVDDARRSLSISAAKGLRSVGLMVLILAAVVAAVVPSRAAAQGPVPQPIPPSGGGYVVEAGCILGTDTSVWKTDSNGGSFGLQSVCPANSLASYPNGLSVGGGSAADGQYASWYTSVPGGMQIAWVNVDSYFARGLTAGGWAGDWKAGGQTIGVNNTNGGTPDAGQLPGGGTLFGWSIQCRAVGGCTNNGDLIQVGQVVISAQETQGPTMAAPTGLWQTSGYVWGNATVAASGNGPSGVCDLSASLNGQALPGATTRTPDQSVWDQCGPASFNQVVNTANYGQGPVPLVFSDADAAGLGGPVEKTVYLDNTVPTISLAGPTDASAASGTQYITATATAFPADGVKGISCELDGGAAQWYPGASASIPVSGVAVHHLTCFSENNAQNATTGQPEVSSPAAWTLSIRQPSVSTESFARIRLKCRRVRVRERIPAHLVKLHRHHKVVWVKRRARTVVRHEKRCHVRSMVLESSRRVRYGKGATVSGWLGTTGGVALGGQQLQVMTAPNNGSNAFTPAASVTTAANGTWTAKLPAGPSRLVQAVYGGASTVEPATSAPIKLLVPAKVRIHVAPASVPWGGMTRITGTVLGGYVPTSSNILKLEFGNGPKPHTIGTPAIAPDGRFSIPVTWSSGRGVVHYWFAVATLAEADYPYSRGISRRVRVTVGVPKKNNNAAAGAQKRHHKRHRKRAKKKKR